MSHLLSILFEKMSHGLRLNLSSHAKEIWENPEVALTVFGAFMKVFFSFGLFVYISAKIIIHFRKKTIPTNQEDHSKIYTDKFLFYCYLVFLAVICLIAVIYFEIQE